MIMRSKNNIHKPIQKLCLSSKVESISSSKTDPSIKPEKLIPYLVKSLKSKKNPPGPYLNPKPIEPRTIHQALKDPRWREVMNEELCDLQSQGTWTLVPPVPHTMPVGSKWIFRVKYNSDGSVGWYKARLVAKGFLQRLGVDCVATYSPLQNTILSGLFFLLLSQMIGLYIN